MISETPNTSQTSKKLAVKICDFQHGSAYHSNRNAAVAITKKDQS
jgi:hypothetical protein